MTQWVTQYIHSSIYIFACKCLLQWVIDRFKASSFCYLVLGSYWNSSCTFYYCLVQCQDPTALDLHVWSFHVLYKFTNEVDVEMGQIISLVLGLGSNWDSKPDSFPSSSPTEWALKHYPGYLAAPDNMDQDQFFFFYAVGISTSVPGSGLMYFSGRVQGTLSQVLQLVRCRTRSPVLMPQKASSLTYWRKQGAKGAIISSPMPPYGKWYVWCVCLLSHLHLCFANSVTSTVLHRQDAGSPFLSAEVCERQD